ncbi:MAG: M20/M25/M40 family metallo-hydrolase [Candidatus Adiutrix sp.]|nr:M20/M25/M40 family metallo-hydrolase [Candidatus Adiutrix sp.]
MTYAPIVEEFLELVKIESHCRRERALADAVKTKLEALGFTVEEDQVGALIGGDTGNLIARLEGDPERPPILWSAHLDRVDNHGHIQPRIADGVIRSDGSSILGADDVSGLCAILDGLRRVQAEKIPHGDLEVVFSVAEEVGLLGARYLDYSRIKSRTAYVVDTGGPLGSIVNQAPAHYGLKLKIYGHSAHAGMEPENGLSAIRVGATALSRLREGRLSRCTTSNFGIFQAGKQANIVCDYAEITGEARSTCPRELENYIEEVRLLFTKVADEFGARMEMGTNLEYPAFRVDESEEVVRLAALAMRRLGLSPRVIPGGGGLDGNYFNEHGIQAVGLSPGYQKVHSSEEAQPVEDLVKMGRLVTEIMRAAAGA